MKAINMDVKPDATIFGLNGYMEALDKVFAVLYPIFYQQVQLFKLWQSGEDHLSYMDQIFRQSLKINYDTLDWEAFCILHFATLVNDERLRNKIIAMEKLMKENAMKIVVKYVSTKVSSQSIEEWETANVVATYNSDMKHPPFCGGGGSRRWRPCSRCGKASHHSNDCYVLAGGLCCDVCGKKGALSKCVQFLSLTISNKRKKCL